MWLLVLLVLKWNRFLLEAANLHGNYLVTHWLLVGYSLMQLFMTYPTEEDTDLDKNADLLVEVCYLLLYLWSIWQMIIGLLFKTEPCISSVNTYT